MLKDHRSWFRHCPFISVMGFAGLCDISSPYHKGPFPPEFYRRITAGGRVFVLRNQLNDFLSWLPSSTPPFVLVSSNFDEPVYPELQKRLLQTGKIVRWYACNLMSSVDENRIFPLPLGMPFHRHESPVEVATLMQQLASRNKNDRILVNFAGDTPFRSFVIRSLVGHPKVDIIRERQSLDSYLQTMSRYRFVLSAPGVGYDCFRTWEAIALGCTPIVFRHRHYDMRLFAKQPIWVIDNVQQLWKEYPEVYHTDNSIVFLQHWKRVFLQ